MNLRIYTPGTLGHAGWNRKLIINKFKLLLSNTTYIFIMFVKETYDNRLKHEV